MQKSKNKIQSFLSRAYSSLFVRFMIFIGVVASFIYFNGQAKNGPSPTITVTNPVQKSTVTDSQVFTEGKVTPVNALVTVNGKSVAMNGNGEFTALVAIPLGQSILSSSHFFAQTV